MLGEAFRLIASAQALQSLEMMLVERLHRAHRQTDAVNRQRVVFTQATKLRVRRSACAHIVLRVHLEETDRLSFGIDRRKMLRLKSDARKAGELGWPHNGSRSIATPGKAAAGADPRHRRIETKSFPA